MTKEYIEREAAKARLRIWITDCVLDGNNDEADCFRDCIDLLDSILAADVAQVRRGRWIDRIGRIVTIAATVRSVVGRRCTESISGIKMASTLSVSTAERGWHKIESFVI